VYVLLVHIATANVTANCGEEEPSWDRFVERRLDELRFCNGTTVLYMVKSTALVACHLYPESSNPPNITHAITGTSTQ